MDAVDAMTAERALRSSSICGNLPVSILDQTGWSLNEICHTVRSKEGGISNAGRSCADEGIACILASSAGACQGPSRVRNVVQLAHLEGPGVQQIARDKIAHEACAKDWHLVVLKEL